MARIITVHGRVIGLNSGKGLGNLKVEVWDKDFNSKHFVERTITAKDGSFFLEFDQEYFTKIYRDIDPDLYFLVYEGDKLVKTTEKDVIWNIKTNDVEIDLEVEEDKLTAAETSYTFAGTVQHTNGSPLAGLTVALYEVYAGGRELLETTETGREGFYSLSVIGVKLRPEQMTVVQLEVLDEQEVLSSSSLISHLEKINTVPFVIDVGRPQESSFARFANKIDPLLGDLDDSILEGEISQRDMDYLSLVSGQSKEEIEQFIKAREFAHETGLEPEIVYAFLSQGLKSMDEILKLSDANLEDMLEKAVANHMFGKGTSTDLKEIGQKLDDALLRQITGDQNSLLGKLLSQVVDEKEKTVVLAGFRSRTEDEAGYWKRLSKTLGKKKTGDLQNLLSLNTVVGQQLEMSLALMDKVGEGKIYPTLKSLARMDRVGWEKLIAEVSDAEKKLCVPETIDGQNDEEKRALYAASLAETLRSAYPTEAFRGDMERDTRPDSPFSAAKENLTTFFDNNPDFDFRKDRTYALSVKDTPYSFAGLD
ncbi:MAG: hypothetical protein LBB49_06445, partial [Gracilibacteraceae bacterium]|nr:hypothetical protein [Gracilibacteraceae bacterium]